MEIKAGQVTAEKQREPRHQIPAAQSKVPDRQRRAARSVLCPEPRPEAEYKSGKGSSPLLLPSLGEMS